MALATKGISFGYDPIGDITSIERYTNLVQAPNPSPDARRPLIALAWLEPSRSAAEPSLSSTAR